MFKQLIDTNFSNHPEVTELTKNVIKSINVAFSKHKLSLKYDILIFVEVLKKTQHDLNTLSDDMNGNLPNIYKQYAIFAYWLKRLKPFTENRCKYANYTNETIALVYAIAMINQSNVSSKKITTIPKEFFNNTLYIIRFEQVSKYGMLLLLTSMFET